MSKVRISVAEQSLALWQDGALCARYPVSTATNGVGEIGGSGCTPRGLHHVRARIGQGLSPWAVLKGRRVDAATPECTAEALQAQPHRDWILGRILWLSGLERGRNRLGCVDTFRRYIYIHGTPHTAQLGQPASHGCIRMAPQDVVDLFDRVPVGTQVVIA